MVPLRNSPNNRTVMVASSVDSGEAPRQRPTTRRWVRMSVGVLALLAGCAEPSKQPRLERVAPEKAEVSALPLTLRALGRNLDATVMVDLGSQAPPRAWPVRVYLSGKRLEVSDARASEIRATVPSTMRPGLYDVEVRVGRDRTTILVDAFEIVGSTEPVTPAAGSGGRDAAAGGAGTGGKSGPDAGTGDAATAGANGTNTAGAATDDTAGAATDDTAGAATDDPGAAGTGGNDTLSDTCADGSFLSRELVTIEGMAGRSVWSPSLSADFTTLYFGLSGTREEIWTATRPKRGTVFSGAALVEGVNDEGDNGSPFLAPDGLSLYFYSNRAGGQGDRDLYVAKRRNPQDSFSELSSLGVVNSTGRDHFPWVAQNELLLMFVSERDGGRRWWVAERGSRSDDFASPSLLPGFDAADSGGRLHVTASGLTMFFSAQRSDGLGGDDIYYATRPSLQSSFGNVANVAAINTTGTEMDVTVSDDGIELFFVTYEGAGTALYRSVRACVDTIQ